jgi:hypothetical protein
MGIDSVTSQGVVSRINEAVFLAKVPDMLFSNSRRNSRLISAKPQSASMTTRMLWQDSFDWQSAKGANK